MKSRPGFVVKHVLFGMIFLALPLLVNAQTKFALVIGNNAYQRITPLANPVNDAEDMAAALRRLGYQVELQRNIGIDGMETTIERYMNRLSANTANEGFFWYAGHGVQIDGENYLLPVDVVVDRLSQVQRGSYSLTTLLEDFKKARNRINVVVLDACRDNPLPANGRSLERGLAAVSKSLNLQDIYVVYSTASGSKAIDGKTGSRNSPFAAAFLKYIDRPQSIEDLIKDVAQETIQVAGGQRPYTEGNILTKGYSLAGGTVSGAGVVPPVAPQASSTATGTQVALNSTKYSIAFLVVSNETYNGLSIRKSTEVLKNQGGSTLTFPGKDETFEINLLGQKSLVVGGLNIDPVRGNIIRIPEYEFKAGYKYQIRIKQDDTNPMIMELGKYE